MEEDSWNNVVSPVVTARVKHLIVNTRDDANKSSSPLARTKAFYADKSLIVELCGTESGKGKGISIRKTICTIGELENKVEIPVNLHRPVGQGQRVQLKLYIASEGGDEADFIFASNSVTIANSGMISCQLSASGIICNVHVCIDLFTAAAIVDPIDKSTAAAISSTDLDILEIIQLWLCSRFWMFYAMFFLLLLLVHLANSVSPPENSSDAPEDMLNLYPGDVLRAGDLKTGCFAFPDMTECSPAILTLHDNGDLAIYIYANKQKLEFSLSNCFALNNKGDVVSSLSSQKVGPPVDESDSGGQIASDIVKDICIEPAWHSGGFVRWKQLLKLSFGNYYCRLDSTGYLRIYKGKKEIWSEYLRSSDSKLSALLVGEYLT